MKSDYQRLQSGESLQGESKIQLPRASGCMADEGGKQHALDKPFPVGLLRNGTNVATV